MSGGNQLTTLRLTQWRRGRCDRQECLAGNNTHLYNLTTLFPVLLSSLVLQYDVVGTQGDLDKVSYVDSVIDILYVC